MNLRTPLTSTIAALMTASMASTAMPVMAQDAALPEDEPIIITTDNTAHEQVIIVTGSIRQGGTQDIKHFRSISKDDEGMPLASSFTLEGLMGEHDLTLPAQGKCEQLFCINAQAMAADLPSEPQIRIFVGMGFESGVDAEKLTSEPLSLIAVVDRSGSMDGKPMERVKEGLHAAVGQMRKGDRLGIVIYGSETNVHMPVMDVAGNRDAIRNAIDGIEINGSTSMAAGLKLGYATAFAELEKSRGSTRIMLFSDENANVGDTSTNGFMGQATRGAEAGIGLTTIGVGRIFDGALATKISSVKGGNLFFVDQGGDAKDLFQREFFNMVSEVARDIKIAITPAEGYHVENVYGVPASILSRSLDGTVTATIGSAFLSSNGGGIYASLSGESDHVSPAKVSIDYTDMSSRKQLHDSVQVAVISSAPPQNLRKAQLLVDQYASITGALNAFHKDENASAAHASLAQLAERFDAAGLKGMDEEVDLIAGLQKNAYKIVHRDTDPAYYKPRQLYGEWKVLRHKGVSEIARGDIVQITDDMDFITKRMSGRDNGDDIWQFYEVNERQIHIPEGQLVMNYAIKGDRLKLVNAFEGTEIVMRRMDDS